MQTRDNVGGLHNDQAIQIQEKSFLLLKYCFFRKNTVTLPFTSNLFVNVKFHSA